MKQYRVTIILSGVYVAGSLVEAYKLGGAANVAASLLMLAGLLGFFCLERNEG